MYKGINIAWWHSTCAEQVALSNAYYNSHQDIEYVITYKKHYKTKEIYSVSPCGVCRQMFAQMNHNAKCLIVENEKEEKFVTIRELLPY